MNASLSIRKWEGNIAFSRMRMISLTLASDISFVRFLGAALRLRIPQLLETCSVLKTPANKSFDHFPAPQLSSILPLRSSPPPLPAPFRRSPKSHWCASAFHRLRRRRFPSICPCPDHSPRLQGCDLPIIPQRALQKPRVVCTSNLLCRVERHFSALSRLTAFGSLQFRWKLLGTAQSCYWRKTL